MRIVKTLLFTLSFLCCYLANTQTLVKDINDALIGFKPQLLTESSDYLYFVANSPEYGTELFRTNEEGTELVKDFYQRATVFKNLYNYLLAFLSKPESNTIELWKIEYDNKKATLLKTFGIVGKGIIVGEEVVEEREEEINNIDNFKLTAALNPFTKLTNIQYQIPERGEANLLLFTAQAQLARSILSVQILEAGQYTATLDGSD